LKFIRGKIEQHWKFETNQGCNWEKIRNQRTKMKKTKTTPFRGWLFIFFSREAARVVSFLRHFMLHLSIKLDKTYTKMITWHLTTLKCGLFLLINTTEAVTSLQSGQLDQSFLVIKLAAHDNYFEATVVILSGRTKGQDLTPYEIKFPSSIPYK
jgi:hypothetical protein